MCPSRYLSQFPFFLFFLPRRCQQLREIARYNTRWFSLSKDARPTYLLLHFTHTWFPTRLATGEGALLHKIFLAVLSSSTSWMSFRMRCIRYRTHRTTPPPSPRHPMSTHSSQSLLTYIRTVGGLGRPMLCQTLEKYHVQRPDQTSAEQTSSVFSLTPAYSFNAMQDDRNLVLLGAALPGEQLSPAQRQLHAHGVEHSIHALPLRRGRAVQLRPVRKGEGLVLRPQGRPFQVG